MKFNIGDKVKYRDFIVKRSPELEGTFVVDQVAESKHDGCNLISAENLPSDELVCSADFVLAEDNWDETFRLWDKTCAAVMKKAEVE